MSELKPHAPIQRLGLDLFDKGRVFVVGDVHGCLDLLIRGLDQINFNTSRDALLCVGDLIDRGPRSFDTLRLLREPWFYAVRGNHEEMLLAAARSPENWKTLKENGGQWWFELAFEQQREAVELAQSMPFAIELESPIGRVGVVHADLANTTNWDVFTYLVEAGDRRVIEAATWGRKRIKARDDSLVQDAVRVYVGHTIVPGPGRLGNVFYLDTGAFFIGAPSPAAPPCPALTIAQVTCNSLDFSASKVKDGLRIIL